MNRMTSENGAENAPVADGAATEGEEQQALAPADHEEEGLPDSQVGDSNTTTKSRWNEFQFLFPKKGSQKVLPYQDLTTDETIMKHSLWALQFNVVASAINTKLLNPNFAIMASGQDPDSFPNTDPFDFNSATYFLPMSSLMGVAIASIFTGQLSDRVGRVRVIQVSTILASAGSIGMYFARETFWGFCGASFAAGLFKGTLPVAMAYIGDIFTTKKEKSDHLSFVVGCYVLGNAGGGIFAILMENSGLFTPLFLGAAFVFLSFFINLRYLIEPNKDVKYTPLGKDKLAEEEEGNDEDMRPKELNNTTLWHIIAGAFADNVGSTALFPLCLSPLALEQYHLDFVVRTPPENPIMTLDAYKWLSVLVALMVIPGTLITPKVFSWIGPAGGCVFGNLATAVLTIALLLIGNGPVTTGMFAFFIIVMYVGFPLTVVSQLSTGPMLDLIAPEDKIGTVQGLNNMVMNFGMAISPWIFGILADGIGTNPTLWIGIGISVGAAVINWPLMYLPGMGRPEKRKPQEKRWVTGENEAFVEKALAGSFVDPEDLRKLNYERARNGQRALIPGVLPYEDDKDNLDVLRSQALSAFKSRKEWADSVLVKLASPEYNEKLPEICDSLNHALEGDPEEVSRSHQQLGQWFGDYLLDAGYEAQVNPILVKQMIMSAFPPINPDHELNPENIESVYLRARRVLNEYMYVGERERYGINQLMGKGGAPVYFS